MNIIILLMACVVPFPVYLSGLKRIRFSKFGKTPLRQALSSLIIAIVSFIPLKAVVEDILATNNLWSYSMAIFMVLGTFIAGLSAAINFCHFFIFKNEW